LPLSAPEPLTAAHDVSLFSCGNAFLDAWLKTKALANQARGFTVVMVVHDDGRVVGYYGLAPTAVSAAAMPRSVRTGQPPHPVPCLLLGQLAVDGSHRGRGLGPALLSHALQRAVAGAELIGGRAVVVHAVDPAAAAFWRRHGFVPSKDEPLTLFRAISDIAASIRRAEGGFQSQVLY
jgi:GNAT superfamily N-acetyltransferase